MGSGVLLKQAIQKYGIENFNKEILEKCETEEELRLAEERWIDREDAIVSDRYYNIAPGGQGGFLGEGNHPKMSPFVKKTWDSYTPEQRTERGKIVSAARKKHGTAKGSKNPMYGRSAVKENNLKWYTNGTDNVYVTEGTEPDGYHRGRTTKWQGKNR